MRRLLFALGAAGAVFGAGGAFTCRQTRRTELEYPPTGRFVEAEGLRLHLVDRGPTGPADHGNAPAAGDGTRSVVLIHGLRGSSADFSFSILDQLAERYRVLAFDRPGSGYSDPAPNGGGSPLTQARLLNGALRSLGVERPLLVAHSLGAALAMTYAVEYPDELAGVVTLSGHALPFDGDIGGTSRIADVPLVGRLLVHTLITPLGLYLGPRGLRRTMAPQTPTPAYTRAAVRLAIRPRAFFAAAADARQCNAGLRTVYTRYGEIGVPVVALAGGADQIISPNESLSLSRLLPNGEFRELPGSGHMPFFADPAAVCAAVDRAWQLAAETHTAAAAGAA